MTSQSGKGEPISPAATIFLPQLSPLPSMASSPTPLTTAPSGTPRLQAGGSSNPAPTTSTAIVVPQKQPTPPPIVPEGRELRRWRLPPLMVPSQQFFLDNRVLAWQVYGSFQQLEKQIEMLGDIKDHSL